ncbi:MAG TPA: hypothetical protein DIC60_03510 [Lachnospiraceae bacterium]|nr:hypothetical protein [Lachnospiraceae bacterium]
MGKGHFSIKYNFKSQKAFVQAKALSGIVTNKVYTVKNVAWSKKPYFALRKKGQQKVDKEEFEAMQKHCRGVQ